VKSISTELARELIDFAPTEKAKKLGFGESQLHGTVSAYNMLAQNKIAYLADEVGMGKTYIALGVLGLLRHLNPEARVMIIAPRENIQRKWIKELSNFVVHNWQVEDNRFKGLNGKPVYTPMLCGSFQEFSTYSRISDQRDPFLRMTMFSIASRQPESRKRYRTMLRKLLPWVNRNLMSSRDPFEFRDDYGRVVNALVPNIDLLIVDEAHNLKHGFGSKVSTRNRVLGLALGHKAGARADCPWYGQRVKRVLLLSATPFEYDYADIYRQLDVLGFADTMVTRPDGTDPLPVRLLCDKDNADLHKTVIKRFLMRRVAYMNIADKKYSKNMYRREWRLGGLDHHDDPMAMTDIKQRLVVGLIQKKVAEILGDKRFNNCFQIGMLSSFESFLESMKQTRKAPESEKSEDDEENEETERKFEGRQDATNKEKRGIDTHSLATVVDSYRKRFNKSLPHPKLDATSDAIANAFNTGEKALVFVRRVATVSELKAKLDSVFDKGIRRRMEEALPGMKEDLNRIFRLYKNEKRAKQQKYFFQDSALGDTKDEEFILDDDEGGSDSFFAWFFRGKGPKNMLSGAAFQKNRLASISSIYATFFEDDYVAWLLESHRNPLKRLARRLKMAPEKLSAELKWRAFGHFSRKTERKEGYPRLYVFEAYQIAALQLLKKKCPDLRAKALTILDERFPVRTDSISEPPAKFPDPQDGIGITTFFTELNKRPSLREMLWPEKQKDDFRAQFRDREFRRELLSGMARLGAVFIDLYLLGIKQLGTFDLNVEAKTKRPEVELINDFLDLLQTQSKENRFNAFHELSHAADAFDTLVSVNFPELHHAKLSQVATIYGRTLQKQVPAGKMSGRVNKRLVRQFRMPGFPLVLATTDVLQEGEDLHTFCGRVLHYGISWTPSAMEQRTGRIDRIDSLVQRNLDGRNSPPSGDELIQVYYPHLVDTVEVLQVKRVLKRLFDFLSMIHLPKVKKDSDQSRLYVAQEILEKCQDIPRLEGLLESAFPVRGVWMAGQLDATHVERPDIERLEDYLKSLWGEIKLKIKIDDRETPQDSKRRYVGKVILQNRRVVRAGSEDLNGNQRGQSFQLELRSQVFGGATLLRCISPVGEIDLLHDQDNLDELYGLQYSTGMSKICAIYNPKRKKHLVTVEGDRLFDLTTTQWQEVEDLIVRTVEVADEIENKLLKHDEDTRYLAVVREGQNK
jgi:ERCC4-related helicase